MTTTEYANWDMTSYFDAFDSEQYRTFRDGYKENVAAVQARAADLGPLTDQTLSR